MSASELLGLAAHNTASEKELEGLAPAAAAEGRTARVRKAPEVFNYDDRDADDDEDKPKKKAKDEDETDEENPQDAPAGDAPAEDAPAGNSDDATPATDDGTFENVPAEEVDVG